MSEWLVKIDGEIECRCVDQEAAEEQAKIYEEEEGIQPELIEIEEAEDHEDDEDVVDNEFIAACIINGEIEEAFDGSTIEEACNRAIQWFMVHKPAKVVKFVVHSEITEKVVESFEMTDLND